LDRALALRHELAILSQDAHFDERVAGVQRVGW
jgi:hypothetical protein